MTNQWAFILLIVLAACGVRTAAAVQDEWYKDEPMRCDSVATTSVLEGINATFPRRLPAKGRSNTGKLYLEWPAADYKAIQGATNHSRLRLSHTMTAIEASTFASWFRDLGNAGVPWYANAAASTSAWMIPEPALRFLFKGMWTLVAALVKNNNAQLSAAQLAPMFAAGGELREIVTADGPAPGRPYLSDSVVYQVKIGNEVRNYTILSCTYAVNLQ